MYKVNFTLETKRSEVTCFLQTWELDKTNKITPMNEAIKKVEEIHKTEGFDKLTFEVICKLIFNTLQPHCHKVIVKGLGVEFSYEK